MAVRFVVAVVAFVVVVGVVGQPTVPSVSATVTPTPSVTGTPNSISVTTSPSASPGSMSVTASVTPTPGSTTPTASVTASPFASLSGRWCQRDPCIVGSCISGSRCCNGFCINDAYVPATIAIGGTCIFATYTIACTLCGPGMSCDLDTNTCVVYGIGYGCSGVCSASTDCAFGLTCTVNSKCGFANLSVGAACNSAATCYPGLTCTNNVCTAVPTGGVCTSANQPYDPSLSTTAVRDYFMLDGGCVNTDYCPFSVCTAKMATGSACTGPQQCWSGICNAGFCAAANSVGSQEACTSINACAAGLFCGGGACQPVVGQGARCTQSFVLPYTPATQGWCQSGLMCSNYDNSRPQCMPANVPVGGACYNSDQCSPASHFGCTPDTPQPGTMWARGVPGKCSGSSYGLPCIPSNNTWCSNSDPYGGTQINFCGTCTNTDGSFPGIWVCDGPPAPSPCQALQTDAVQAVYSGGYYQSNSMFVAAIALGGSSAAINYMCCTSCKDDSIALGQGAINSAAAQLGRSVDCLTGIAGPAFTGTTLEIVCGGTQTIAIPGSALLGTCAGGTQSPSTSVSISITSSATPTISLTSSVTPTISFSASVTATPETHPAPAVTVVVLGLAVALAVVGTLLLVALVVICMMYRKMTGTNDYDRKSVNA